MSVKIFLDTNVLAYAADNADPVRKKAAHRILKEVVKTGSGVISTQVLQEFYVTATRKLGIDPIEAKNLAHSFEHFEIVTVSVSMIKDAVDCSVVNKISFWDALIVTAAENARAAVIYTEDLNHLQIINGVKIANPFI